MADTFKYSFEYSKIGEELEKRKQVPQENLYNKLNTITNALTGGKNTNTNNVEQQLYNTVYYGDTNKLKQQSTEALKKESEAKQNLYNKADDLFGTRGVDVISSGKATNAFQDAYYGDTLKNASPNPLVKQKTVSTNDIFDVEKTRYELNKNIENTLQSTTEYQNYVKASDEAEVAKWTYEANKALNDEISVIEAFVKNPINETVSMLESITGTKVQKLNIGGTEINVPYITLLKSQAYQNAIDENISNNFLNWATRMGLNLESELTKYGVAQGLNALTGGYVPIGTILYDVNIYTSTKSDAILQGYSDGKASLYAMGVTALNGALDLVTGGAGSKLRENTVIGKALEKVNVEKILEKGAFKATSSIFKNHMVAHIISTATSGGIDEFTDEYSEAILKFLVLDDAEGGISHFSEIITDPELLQQALEAAIIGAAMGAISGGNPDSWEYETFIKKMDELIDRTTDETKLNAYNKILDDALVKYGEVISGTAETPIQKIINKVSNKFEFENDPNKLYSSVVPVPKVKTISEEENVADIAARLKQHFMDVQDKVVKSSIDPSMKERVIAAAEKKIQKANQSFSDMTGFKPSESLLKKEEQLPDFQKKYLKVAVDSKLKILSGESSPKDQSNLDMAVQSFIRKTREVYDEYVNEMFAFKRAQKSNSSIEPTEKKVTTKEKKVSTKEKVTEKKAPLFSSKQQEVVNKENLEAKRKETKEKTVKKMSKIDARRKNIENKTRKSKSTAAEGLDIKYTETHLSNELRDAKRRNKGKSAKEILNNVRNMYKHTEGRFNIRDIADLQYAKTITTSKKTQQELNGLIINLLKDTGQSLTMGKAFNIVDSPETLNSAIQAKLDKLREVDDAYLNISFTAEQKQRVKEVVFGDNKGFARISREERADIAIDMIMREWQNELRRKDIKKNTLDKLNSWRKAGMLSRFSTHVRNIVSNLANYIAYRINDITAVGVENIISAVDKNFFKNDTYTKEYTKEELNEIKALKKSLKENKFVEDQNTYNKNEENVKNEYAKIKQIDDELKNWDKNSAMNPKKYTSKYKQSLEKSREKAIKSLAPKVMELVNSSIDSEDTVYNEIKKVKGIQRDVIAETEQGRVQKLVDYTSTVVDYYKDSYDKLKIEGKNNLKSNKSFDRDAYAKAKADADYAESRMAKLLKFKQKINTLKSKGYRTHALKTPFNNKKFDDAKSIAKIYSLLNRDKISGNKYDLSNEHFGVFGLNRVTSDWENIWTNGSLSIKDKWNMTWGSAKIGLKQYSEMDATERRGLQKLGDAMQTFSDVQYALLSVEDYAFTNLAYKNAFSQVLAASPKFDEKMEYIRNTEAYKSYKNKEEAEQYAFEQFMSENEELCEYASQYALDYATEVTMHDANALQSIMNSIKTKSKNQDPNSSENWKAVEQVVDAIFPFIKTNVNAGKRFMEFTPVGLFKSLTTNVKNFKEGKITSYKFIQNLSKGLTGTGMIGLGIMLTKMGLIAYNEDKDKHYLTLTDETGTNSASLDPFLPGLGPILMGSDMYSSIIKNEDVDALDILNVFLIHPLSEASLLGTLNDMLTTAKYSSDSTIAEVGIDLASSYVSSFIPGWVQDIGKILDPYNRVINDPDKNIGKEFLNSILYRLPIAREQLEIKYDNWGNPLQTNTLLRHINTFFPFDFSRTTREEITEEIGKLQEITGESSLLPSLVKNSFEYKGEKYVFTAKEKQEYQKLYGQTSMEGVDKLINSDNYKYMTYDQQAKAIKKIYEYGNIVAKESYLKTKNIDYEADTWYYKINDANIDISDYAIFNAKANSDYNDDKDLHRLNTINAIIDYDGTDYQKAILYKTTSYGSNNKTIDIVMNTGIDVDAYLNLSYRTYDLKADLDPNSKYANTTISGSKKKKIMTEIAKTKNITSDQKLLLTYVMAGTIQTGDYSGITKNEARQRVFNYVNKLKIPKSDKEVILDAAGYKKLKNGNYTW